MNKKYLIFTASLLVLIISGEILLRKKWGFCNTVLIREDEKIEYIAQPNQNRNRFGNNIIYNQFSMRSYPVSDNVSDSLVILGFGDSVINGGVQTEHSNLATTLLENSIQKIIPYSRVLNISYGSWGPDNNYEYLKKYGDFGAKVIFLVVSSHDAHDNITHEKIVDIHPSFPSKQYRLAYLELLERYLIPKIKNIFLKDKGIIDKSTKDPIAISKKFNSGFENFRKYCEANNISFFIYLHAEKDEINSNKYSEQGLEIIKYCEEHNVPLLKELDYKPKLNYLSDNIHMNTKEGQYFMYEIIFDYLKKKLNNAHSRK